MKIGVLTAMTSEFEQLAALLDGVAECTLGGIRYLTGRVGVNEVVLRQCGIGKVNAALGAAELIRSFSPDAMVSTGVAGGIDECLGVMDVVVSSSIVYHDVWCGMGCDYGQVQGMPTFFPASEALWQKAMALNDAAENNTRIHVGLICTGDQFITNREELDKIKSNFPAGLAVDMESAAIAQTCYIHGVPFVSFRIISDTPGVDKHIEQYENFWGEMANRSFGVTRSFLSTIQDFIMEKIPSFTIDHLRLKRGIYVSRKDIVGGETVTTFDVRMKESNREPALSPSAIHTMEHLAATFLRNHSVWANKIVYWGPMGCLTGNYLIVKGNLESADVLPLMKETFAFIASFEGEVPGATARDCGNYLLMNLPEARWEARKYLAEVLECATEENLNYPQ